jgi:sialate O-acetylesterase
VIIDIGEANDIHPTDKQNVAKRLVRWALRDNYGYNIPYHSPQYASMEKDANGVVKLTFDHVGGGLETYDVSQPRGFAVAGEDKKFVWATSVRIATGNTIEVSAEAVKNPVAVRYAWADNPVCNVQSREGLPLTPFRTDNWPGVTDGKGAP